MTVCVCARVCVHMLVCVCACVCVHVLVCTRTLSPESADSAGAPECHVWLLSLRRHCRREGRPLLATSPGAAPTTDPGAGGAGVLSPRPRPLLRTSP